jgi:hypothetical protein
MAGLGTPESELRSAECGLVADSVEKLRLTASELRD